MLRPFLMLALLIPAAPALALDAAALPAAAKAKDPKRKICEPVEETGSRLSSKRICLTAEQWEAQRGGNRGKPSNKASGAGGGK